MTKAKERKTKRELPDAELIAWLADPGDDLEVLAELMHRLGTFPDCEMVADVLKKITNLWPTVREQAVARCIQRDPGQRPTCWWRFDAPPGRPCVVLENCAPGSADAVEAQREADLNFLFKHDLLSPEELTALREQDKRRIEQFRSSGSDTIL